MCVEPWRFTPIAVIDSPRAVTWPCRGGSRLISRSRVLDGLHDQRAEHPTIDVVQLLDVEAAFSCPVLSELRHQRFVLQRRADVEHEVRLARRKTREADVALAAAVVHVV